MKKSLRLYMRGKYEIYRYRTTPTETLTMGTTERSLEKRKNFEKTFAIIFIISVGTQKLSL